MRTTQTTATANDTILTIECGTRFDYAHEGLRRGLRERIVYAVLVLLGKRRAYPICICSWRDDE